MRAAAHVQVGYHCHSTDSVFNEIEETEDECRIQRRHRFLACRFTGYILGCLMITSGFSGLSVGLWSDIGCKMQCLEFLQENEGYAGYCALIVLILMLLLYLFDFFAPTHMPGRYFALVDGNGLLGKGCFALAIIAFVLWGYLSANDYPALPLVITFLFCPMSVMLFRRLTMPVLPECPPSFEVVRSLEERIALIKLLTWEERDEKNFYTAAMYSFGVAGLLCLGAWTPWAVAYEQKFDIEMRAAKDHSQRELVFVMWAAPAFVAVSNLVCASFAWLRVTQNSAYSATDQIKNQLIFDFKSSTQKHMQYRIAWLRARVAAAQNQQELARTTQDQLQKYLVQHISATRRLSKIVKSVGFTIVALIIALHIVFQMMTEVNHVAVMVQGFLASYLLTFAVFIFVSFNRVSRTMTLELMDLPLLKNLAACAKTDWARALALCLALPFMPIILAVSFANQSVRKRRGISRSKSMLTRRVNAACMQMQSWHWPDVLGWCYIMAAALMILRMSPLFLNVLLAWLSWVMADMNFWLICAATFTIGVFLFMLPPVPGPIIYPFAGIVISDPKKCPFGFWWGCVVCVVVSFFMKMTACCLQQKAIGGLLGSNLAVRRAVGIHKAPIRAIENVLRRPGLSFGKCMILCGGPDWPTSVLAGILRLSLWQCVLGTCPVIFSIVPMALTGSFYLKRDESEVWMRTGNLMLFMTTVVSAVFLVGIGWALQDEYDKRGDELSKPKEEFIELEWLDYRGACAAERCRIEWEDIPRLVKVTCVLGAVTASLAGHLLLWCTSRCFGSFQLTDDISTLRWFGRPGALVRPLGLAGLGAAAASYLGLAVFSYWRRRQTQGHLAAVLAELDEQEASWKEARLQEARTVHLKPRRSYSCSSCAPTLLSVRNTCSLQTMATDDFAKTPRSCSAPALVALDVEGEEDEAGGNDAAEGAAQGWLLQLAVQALQRASRRMTGPGFLGGAPQSPQLADTLCASTLGKEQVDKASDHDADSIVLEVCNSEITLEQCDAGSPKAVALVDKVNTGCMTVSL